MELVRFIGLYLDKIIQEERERKKEVQKRKRISDLVYWSNPLHWNIWKRKMCKYLKYVTRVYNYVYISHISMLHLPVIPLKQKEKKTAGKIIRHLKLEVLLKFDLLSFISWTQSHICLQNSGWLCVPLENMK